MRKPYLICVRPGRSAQDAIRKVKEYAEKGYTQKVLVDLSKYFDLNHKLLMNLLRKDIQDKQVTELIKRYLKAGVMENGLLLSPSYSIRPTSFFFCSEAQLESEQ